MTIYYGDERKYHSPLWSQPVSRQTAEEHLVRLQEDVDELNRLLERNLTRVDRRRTERKRDRLDLEASQLHAQLFPPSVGSIFDPPSTTSEFVQCRSCSNQIHRSLVFSAGPWCPACNASHPLNTERQVAP